MSGEPNRPASPSPLRLPLAVLASLLALAVLLVFFIQLETADSFLSGLACVASEGLLAFLILLAALGFGYVLYCRLAPLHTPRLLALGTSGLLGLWLLSTAVLILGSAFTGVLTSLAWWIVVLAGAGLALAQAYTPLTQLRPQNVLPAESLLWVLLAVATGLWLAGAVMPPGWLGNLTQDGADIKLYHMQIPKEYYESGGVRVLPHNVFSYCPLGLGMLYLMAMCLRGGAYEGTCLAQMMPALFVVCGFVALYGSLVDGEPTAAEASVAPRSRWRARAAVILLATVPYALYFSWLPLPELAQCACLMLALAWLHRWLKKADCWAAVWLGMALGLACVTKYQSLGLVAAPLLLIAFIVGLRQALAREPALRAVGIRRVQQALLMGAVATAVLAPWLVRNYATTGNPVFPLATGLLGKGHWSEDSAARWRAAVAPEARPPVPCPPDYVPPPPEPSAFSRLGAFLFGGAAYQNDPGLGLGLSVAGALALLALVLRSRFLTAWDGALVALLLLQAAIWMLGTHGMPGRFMSVCLVPLALLVADALTRLALGEKETSAAPVQPWRHKAALAALVLIAGMGLFRAQRYFRAEEDYHFGALRAHGVDAEKLVLPAGERREAQPMARGVELPAGSKLLTVGEASIFFLPSGTLYATVFDEQPLARFVRAACGHGDATAGSPSPGAQTPLPEPAAFEAALRSEGITHVEVYWADIERCRLTYGWPSELSQERLRSLFKGWPMLVPTEGPAAWEARRGLWTVYAVPPPPAH